MRKSEAKKLSQYHKFTKKELFDILTEVYDTYNENYWDKPNKINPIFNNGYFFNRCIEWLDYNGKNGDDLVYEIFTTRILEMWGNFSKIQLPKKKTSPKPDIIRSEKPILSKFDNNNNES